ncbi:MAG: HAMP domain-containing histidine kinase [Desulfobacterales bacterium]|nr:HAMP domain-containing histidine kinase [Desulfobacterales bacterium]
MKKYSAGSWIGNLRNLALFHIGVFLVSGVIVSVFLYLAYQTNVYAETRAALKADIHGFVDAYHFSRNPSTLRNLVEQRMKSRDISSFYLLMDENGNRITGNLQAMPSVIDSREDEFTIYEVHDDEVTGNAPERGPYHHFDPYYDVMTVSVAFENGMSLLVGRDVDTYQNFHWIIILFAWMTAILVSVLTLIGFLTGAMMLKHVRLIHTTADTVIKTGDLSSRIPVNTATGDFKHLINTLNTMLNRIQDLVMGIRHVSDNVAHDLRTPLTRLRQHIDALESGNTIPGLDRIALETDQIIATFNALLRIANIEHGKRAARFCPVNVILLLNDIHDYYLPLAEDKEIAIHPDVPHGMPLSVMGDKDLLFQAFSNMVENALKFTPPKGSVHLAAACRNNAVIITIADTGPGIPKKDRPFVFQRFYRAQNNRNTGGNGLGLSLVKAIMDLHTAPIDLDDNPPSGLRIKICFPVAEKNH